MPIHALLMFAALMIGHHFSISDLWNAPSASGVAPTLLALADERSNNCMSQLVARIGPSTVSAIRSLG